MPKKTYNTNNFRLNKNDVDEIIDEVLRQLQLDNAWSNPKTVTGNARRLIDKYIDIDSSRWPEKK